MSKLQGTELLEYVLEISQKLAATRELDPLLSYAVDEVLQLVGAERGYIVLATDSKHLDIRVKRDHQGNTLLTGADELSHSIISDVITTGKSLLLQNAMSDPRFSHANSVMHLQLRSIICAPLITNNRTIGAIYLENRTIQGRFRDRDLLPLELFANQAAVSIENATLNEQLQIANESLRQLDEMKNNFILLVSHELRTPLTTVSVYSQLLRQLAESGNVAILEEKTQLYTEYLNDSVIRMNKTIKEIINVVRMISGQMQVHLEPIELAPFIEGITTTLETVFEERNLTLHLDDLTDLPSVMADKEKMQIVFENVLSNAIKYVPDQGSIEISGRLLKNQVEIMIKDTGIGIPVTEQERIFDIFHVLGSLQNHSSSKYAFRGGGLGLGLPITKGFMQAQHGSIRVESPGYDPETCPGTSCHIILPCA